MASNQKIGIGMNSEYRVSKSYLVIASHSLAKQSQDTIIKLLRREEHPPRNDGHPL
jgi:hypothetical protein